MALALLVPFFTMLAPIAVSAAEGETVAPTVSIAWDESTVTLTDGVATPYKNASSTASS